MRKLRHVIDEKPWVGWLLFGLTALVVFALGVLASTVMERRTEAQFLNQRQVDIAELEPRNEVWGLNYPKQYETYLQTRDTTFRSERNASDDLDMIDMYPNLAILWAGYAFAWDYTQARGHFYAITDIRETLRTGAPMAADQGPQPATCWTCKSSDVPRLMNKMGVAEFYGGTWASLGHEVVNSVGCADCHDEETMNLKITRPALIEAFERQGKDINEATNQEMRSLVCAQCHVEYYFNKEQPQKGTPYLTFPWDEGLTIDAMEQYYDSIQFTDWTHALSRAPMLKAQHPDYELYTTGIHAKRGVTCADCHMPYRSEGGVKFTDHKIQSPLNNVANSCQVCHRQSEEELISNVYANQEKVEHLRLIAEDLLAKTHLEAKFAWDQGATEAQMQPILTNIRHAQWRWDFSAASHGASAHAPQESLRLLGTSITLAQEARLKISKVVAALGHQGEIPLPDYSTKTKAQAVVGIPMEEKRSQKQQFISQVIPQWLNQAKERQSQWQQYKSIEPGKLLDAANIEKVKNETGQQEPKGGETRP